MPALRLTVFLFTMVVFFPHAVRGLSTCAPVTVDAPTMGTIGGAAAQAAAETEICNQINNKFRTGNISQVLGYMAKANALSGTGTTADYWSNPRVFTLGAATTLSLNNITPPYTLSEAESFIKRYKENPVPDGGTSLSATASLGISFRQMGFRRRGWFDPKNFNIYFSLLLMPTINYQIYSFKSSAYAVYAQYKVLPMRSVKYGLVTWGGLDFGLGYSYISTTLGVSSTDAITSIPFSASGQTGVYKPAGTLTLKYNSHLIPFEISTNVSLLHFLSFAAGVAADFYVLSSAEISANIDGKVSIDGQPQGTDYAKFSQNESAKLTNVGFRLFFGPQISIWKLRIFTLAHINADKTYASTVGVRFSW